MLVDLEPAAVSLLLDLANDEVKSIQSGITTYGTPDDNIDTLSLLVDAITVLEKAQGF